MALIIDLIPALQPEYCPCFVGRRHFPAKFFGDSYDFFNQVAVALSQNPFFDKDVVLETNPCIAA
jgi:hypothetical protein